MLAISLGISVSLYNTKAFVDSIPVRFSDHSIHASFSQYWNGLDLSKIIHMHNVTDCWPNDPDDERLNGSANIGECMYNPDFPVRPSDCTIYTLGVGACHSSTIWTQQYFYSSKYFTQKLYF